MFRLYCLQVVVALLLLTWPQASKSEGSAESDVKRSAASSSGLFCSFESTDLCGFTNGTADFNWTRNHAHTKSELTGPEYDHTIGDKHGHYMYIETSNPRQPNDTARLISPVQAGSGDQCVTFWYHMYGRDIDRLTVSVLASGQSSNIWERRGQQGNYWHEALVNFQSSQQFQIVFEGSRGKGYSGDIAIDDVKILNQRCPAPDSGDIFTCTFEEPRVCDFQQSTSDTFNWTWTQGWTNSENTGPEHDHTFTNGHYLYIEASSRTPGDRATLTSPQFNGTGQMCLSFWYNMYGSQIGSLAVTLNNNNVWMRQGNQGKNWNRADVTFTASGSFQFSFTGTIGAGYSGDIGLDDVNVTTGACTHSGPTPPTSIPYVTDEPSYVSPGLHGNYSLNLAFFTDANFLHPIRANPLHAQVGITFRVKAYTNTSDFNVAMYLETCYTQPTSSTSETMRYYLIRGGCSVDYNTRILSRESHETRFRFTKYEHGGSHGDINVYCFANFCSVLDSSGKCHISCH